MVTDRESNWSKMAALALITANSFRPWSKLGSDILTAILCPLFSCESWEMAVHLWPNDVCLKEEKVCRPFHDSDKTISFWKQNNVSAIFGANQSIVST